MKRPLSPGLAKVARGARALGLCLVAWVSFLAFPRGVEAPRAQTGAAMTNRPHAPDRADPPRARDGDIAIREEFQAATSAEALRLFVERHPGHPLADEARARLRTINPR